MCEVGCIMLTLCIIYFRAHCITHNVHSFYSQLSLVYLLCVGILVVHCSAEMSFNLVSSASFMNRLPNVSYCAMLKTKDKVKEHKNVVVLCSEMFVQWIPHLFHKSAPSLSMFLVGGEYCRTEMTFQTFVPWLTGWAYSSCYQQWFKQVHKVAGLLECGHYFHVPTHQHLKTRVQKKQSKEKYCVYMCCEIWQQCWTTSVQTVGVIMWRAHRYQCQS